jgi:hypothetical protein
MRLQSLTAVAALIAAVALTGCRREDPLPPSPARPPADTTPAPVPKGPGAVTAPETARPAVDDAAITGEVKQALARVPELPAGDISVTTLNGVVQLSGFVAEEQQVDRAGQIARNVPGVRGVENNLGVRPKP